MGNSLALAIVLLLTQTSAFGFAMQSPYLSLSVQCPDNPECVFNGWDIPIEITIKNSSNQVIGFPYEYIRRVGPYGRLIDNRSMEFRHLRSGLPDRKLINIYSKIAPGAALKIEATLWKHEIQGFGQANVDITAEIGILANIQVVESSEMISFRELVKILILDEQTAKERGRTEHR